MRNNGVTVIAGWPAMVVVVSKVAIDGHLRVISGGALCMCEVRKTLSNFSHSNRLAVGKRMGHYRA